MSNPDPFKAALARAQAAAAEAAVETTIEVYGETFTLRWRPTATPDAISAIGHIQRLSKAAGDDLPADETMKAITDFLDAQALPETAEHLAELLHAGLVGIPELIAIQRDVVELVSGRPTTSSSS